MSVTVEQPVPLQIPAALDRIVQLLPPKDGGRVTESIRRLHEVNGALWLAEDEVRNTDNAEAVTMSQRSIDRLNLLRNQLIDRIDEGFTHLATLHLAKPSTPTHTETLGSVIDRLSVLTLRVRRAEELTATTAHEVAAARLPAIQAQRVELAASISALAVDLESGIRRLPDGRKFKLYGNSVETVARVTVSPNIDHVIALGGLSECGKSSSGQYLRYQEGTYRLKMSFLLDIAARRAGISDPYILDRAAQAGLLLEGLNVFADMHVEARRFTIESVHSDELINALKQMLGDRLSIVYLEAPAHVRAARSGTTRNALRAKDAVKISRGAERVAAGSDHLIDNSGAVISLHAQLRTIANPRRTGVVRIEPAASSFLPTAIGKAVDRFAQSLAAVAGVDLIALTGSSVDGAWWEGWSDLDLLVSARHGAHSIAAQEAAGLRAHLMDVSDATKSAVTLITPGEVASLLVQPRVVYALARLGDGRSPALFAAPDLRLPVISDDKIRHSTQDLPLVIVTLRRLTASAGTPAFDLRQVYKHIVLALRLMLRSTGIDATGADAIADKAEEILIGLGSLSLPSLGALAQAVASGDDSGYVQAVLNAAEILLLWYADQVDAATDAANNQLLGGPE